MTVSDLLRGQKARLRHLLPLVTSASASSSLLPGVVSAHRICGSLAVGRGAFSNHSLLHADAPGLFSISWPWITKLSRLTMTSWLSRGSRRPNVDAFWCEWPKVVSSSHISHVITSIMQPRDFGLFVNNLTIYLLSEKEDFGPRKSSLVKIMYQELPHLQSKRIQVSPFIPRDFSMRPHSERGSRLYPGIRRSTYVSTKDFGFATRAGARLGAVLCRSQRTTPQYTPHNVFSLDRCATQRSFPRH